LSASFLLSVLGEGTFLDLLRFIEVHSPDSVTREIARRTRRIAARALCAVTHPARHRSGRRAKRFLANAVSQRPSSLSDIGTLNPLVEESLIILAAGSLTADALPSGVQAVRELHVTMHETASDACSSWDFRKQKHGSCRRYTLRTSCESRATGRRR